jgi:hypothetical protein
MHHFGAKSAGVAGVAGVYVMLLFYFLRKKEIKVNNDWS